MYRCVVGFLSLLAILLTWESKAPVSRIYKQIGCEGIYYPIGAVENSEQRFVDLDIIPGIFCYKVTHVDQEGVESESSNITKVECVQKYSNVKCRSIY